MYDKQNIFAKIIRKEVPCNLVYEDDFALAFHDMSPLAPLHVLCIPKGEFISFSHFVSTADSALVGNFFLSLQKVIKLLQIESSGYRIISNTGEDGMQTVYHFHVHILAQKILGPLVVVDNNNP